jgi:hypothetical protein
MSSAGFEKVQEIIGRASSATKDYGQPKHFGNGVKRENVQEAVYNDNGAMHGDARYSASQKATYNDARYAQESQSIKDGSNTIITPNHADYASSDRDVRGSYAAALQDYDSGYNSNAGYDDSASCSNSTGYGSNSNYGHNTGYGNNTGYGGTYNNSYNPGYDDYNDY